MIRRPPRSTLFPSRRSSDLAPRREAQRAERAADQEPDERPPDRPGEDIAEECERQERLRERVRGIDRKSTRLNSSHLGISYAVFCLKKKKKKHENSNHEIID